jgi:thiamine monophosphate synthase
LVATATVETAPLTRQPSRAGQINISAWLNADFKTGLRLVQARKGASSTLQDLMAEALNDLFTKYNVPTVRQE